MWNTGKGFTTREIVKSLLIWSSPIIIWMSLTYLSLAVDSGNDVDNNKQERVQNK